ncbi:TraB/GumN family protein [Lentisphaera profundi]|uniref:TraB/GumN family protein n=1 Tax=Lentisphaera profundi TaxID=1658616 RepID=A0ABY7VNV8_9BACT|nr:TraB/GumN family protein [Lentisphaera profundi]WDE95627.1 TraB/GumN family protein [Lentisphaera profundi]
MEKEQNVERLNFGDREIILIGTAHVSKASAEQVTKVIDEEQPDAVCIELCESRYQKIKDPDSWKNMDLVKIFKEGKLILFVINLVLASHQKKIAEKLGINPGQEMLNAISSAEKYEMRLELIDRDVKTTLNRTWGLMSITNKFKLLVSMLGALTISAWTLSFILFIVHQSSELFTDYSKIVNMVILALFFLPFLLPDGNKKEEEVTEETLEKLKEQDMLENLLEEMGENLPDVKKRLIDERDLYMVKKLQQCDAKKMVAVVGAGHVPGMLRHWNDEIDLASLEEMPQPGMMSKFFKYAFPALLVIGGVAGMFFLDFEQIKDLILSYVLITGGGAAIGALVVLSHPWSIFLAFVSAPITILHPALGVGMITGVSEAIKRKPTAGDFENLLDDFGSVKGWMKNRVTRVLLTSVASSMGAILGLLYFCQKYDITGFFKS